MTQIKKKVKIKQKQPTQKDSWFKRKFKRIAIVLIAIVAVILAAIFIPKIGNETDVVVADDTTKNDSVQPAQVVEDSINVDSSKFEVASNVEEKAQVKNAKVEEEKSQTQSQPTVVPEENKSDVKVNKVAKMDNISSTESTITRDTETEALLVIRGKYGNNPDRRRLLKERYQEIQSRVNEMYRNGEVR